MEEEFFLCDGVATKKVMLLSGIPEVVGAAPPRAMKLLCWNVPGRSGI